MIKLKSPAEIEIMAQAGQVVAEVHEVLKAEIRPGVTTAELDALAERVIRSRGGEPTFKGFKGYPAATCMSPNDVVVHGIPGDHRVEEGDLLSVDVGVTLRGYVADSAWTYKVGEKGVAGEDELMRAGLAALYAGVANARVGNRIGDVSSAVEQVVVAAGFSVVEALTGHGVGHAMHEEPEVPNLGRPGQGPLIEEGLVIAVEPMIAQGSERIHVLEDGWTVVTEDGSPAVHFEHTVAVTVHGPRLLTAKGAPLWHP